MGSYKPTTPAQIASVENDLARAYKLRQDAIVLGDYPAYRTARAIRDALELEQQMRELYSARRSIDRR